MADSDAEHLAALQALLVHALRLADACGESLLGAKIDEALTCARDASARLRMH